MVIVIDHAANGQFVLDQRDVEHGVESRIRGAAGGASKRAFNLAFPLVELWLCRDVANHTSLRAAAEQRALRTLEHFDALNVGNVHVGVVCRKLHRLVVEINRNVRKR